MKQSPITFKAPIDGLMVLTLAHVLNPLVCLLCFFVIAGYGPDSVGVLWFSLLLLILCLIFVFCAKNSYFFLRKTPIKIRIFDGSIEISFFISREVVLFSNINIVEHRNKFNDRSIEIVTKETPSRSVVVLSSKLFGRRFDKMSDTINAAIGSCSLK